MRRSWIALVAAAALSGCAFPQEETEQPDPLFGLCPQWQQGPGADALAWRLDGATPVLRENVTAPMDELMGAPFDMVRLRFDGLDVRKGTLELRAYRGGDEQRPIRDHRSPDGPQLRPVLVLAPADNVTGAEFDIHLTRVDGADPAVAGTLVLEWTLRPAGGDPAAVVSATTTYHFRVCAAVVST